MATSSTVGAIAGAVGVPVVGALVDLAGSLINTGSPRYEGGPLISSVEQRLQLLRSGDATAIAQSRSDAVSGGAGWRDAALVLAPAVRPDLFGKPTRTLTADEQGIVAAVGGPTTAAVPAGSAPPAGGTAPAPTPTQASILGGGSLGWVVIGVLVVLGVVAFVLDRRRG